MKTRTDKLALVLVLAIAGTMMGSCAVTVGPPPIRHVPASFEGIYMGNHTVAFNVTHPNPRPMQPSTNPGPIHVVEDAGRIQLSLRLSQTGEPCHVTGVRQGATGRINITPGQRCSIRVNYQGTFVLSGMQINEGHADFVGGTLTTSMRGPFVGEALIGGQRASLRGNARITFSGTRQRSRSL